MDEARTQDIRVERKQKLNLSAIIDWCDCEGEGGKTFMMVSAKISGLVISN